MICATKRETVIFGLSGFVLFQAFTVFLSQRLILCGSSTLEERISRYIAARPEAIEGQRGDETTCCVACRLVWGFGLSEADALRYLRLYSETRCSPKWSERELKSKIQQALKRRKHVTHGAFLISTSNPSRK